MNYRVNTPNKVLPKLANSLVLAASAITLSACGTLSSLGERMPWRSTDPDPVDYSLISINLVDAISQYPKLSPLLATVQVSKPQNPFERQIHEEMTERGFKLEPHKTGQAANGVRAAIHGNHNDDTDQAPLYVLSIGDISAERRFDIIDGNTMPSSELVLRGGDERKVTLNDPKLFGDIDAAYSTVAFKPNEGPTIADVLRPSAEKMRGIVESADEAVVVKRNIYDTMTSNFSGIYTDYEDVEQRILVFPNDSLRLGETNKQIIEQYVEMMDTSTDVLSVIGCSHGATKINNGNSLLAIGRANRVKEAFLFSGIEHDAVMEEGCWAPQTFDGDLPNRGVVLTLKRRKPS